MYRADHTEKRRDGKNCVLVENNRNGKCGALSNRGGLKGIQYKWNLNTIDRRRFRHMFAKHKDMDLRTILGPFSVENKVFGICFLCGA